MKHLIAPSFSGGRNGWLVLPLSARLLEPWKPISDPVQCSKWAGPGTFQNGSLACNIIRNTLGYRLLSPQCDHMRKFVPMRGAQVRLVTWRVLLSPSSFLSQAVMSHPTSVHAPQAPAPFPRSTEEHSLMGNVYTLHVCYVCMNRLACKIQFPESIGKKTLLATASLSFGWFWLSSSLYYTGFTASRVWLRRLVSEPRSVHSLLGAKGAEWKVKVH